ncbi:YajG family lipoprotein [Henriciella litoralis]|uniref:hypothetical protein n=1 Tax=Henriciella litoralis TaxID=568102 RepID=UPI00111C381E|nr:hypothetical protein [Henriciella litoralis]
MSPLPPEDQRPSFDYAPAGPVMVSVIEDRVRTKDGKPDDLIGYARSYGIPNHWKLNVFRQKDIPEGADLGDFLEQRIVEGMTDSGWSAIAVETDEPVADADVDQFLSPQQASRLLTIVIKDWHTDVNLNWVGKFRFDHDAELAVQGPDGTILSKSFKETESVPGDANDSWPNAILRAFSAQVQEMLDDPEVVSALHAEDGKGEEAAEAAGAVASR